MQTCGTLTVPLSATEPLFIAARFSSRAPGTVTLTTSCTVAAPVDMTLLSVTVGTDLKASGFYERSLTEPLRNGLPHWVRQSDSRLYHLFYEPPRWVIKSNGRGLAEFIGYQATLAPSDLFAFTSDGNTAVSITPVCPPSTYAAGGSGNSLTCSACGAYQYAPPGSTSAAACKCAPGAGLSQSLTCAPCTNNTFRASTAANAPCNACPKGAFALDGAQAPAACYSPLCDTITV
jgi:hypothetical protein